MPSLTTAPAPARNRLNPKKLLRTKWTAVAPLNKEKHFLVVELVEPASPGLAVTEVELEAVFSKRIITLPWRDLEETSRWRQGWC